MIEICVNFFVNLIPQSTLNFILEPDEPFLILCKNRLVEPQQSTIETFHGLIGDPDTKKHHKYILKSQSTIFKYFLNIWSVQHEQSTLRILMINFEILK